MLLKYRENNLRHFWRISKHSVVECPTVLRRDEGSQRATNRTPAPLGEGVFADLTLVCSSKETNFGMAQFCLKHKILVHPGSPFTTTKRKKKNSKQICSPSPTPSVIILARGRYLLSSPGRAWNVRIEWPGYEPSSPCIKMAASSKRSLYNPAPSQTPPPQIRYFGLA